LLTLWFCVSVLIRIGDKSEKKPVFQVEIVPEVQIIVIISGKYTLNEILNDLHLEFLIELS